MNYRKINNLTGWAVFGIATLVYLITMEKSGSLWDCGEFASTAHRMGVPHPPGAPLFVMIGRMFSFVGGLFGMSPIVSINTLSALSSSFTILFLFWTITHFARKAVLAKGGQLNNQGTFSIMAAGAIGALAYTFSDSFWYSAVEAEVYALSSLCTAVVFWAILKWEDHPGNTNDPANATGRNQADKWLIFIFFIMGLSIGVHLLNLLTIPAIIVVYYFKRYKTTTQGLLLTLFISVIILGFVQKVVGQWSISAGFLFERFFVNDFGAPVLAGFIFFFVLLGGLIFLGLRYAGRNNLSLLRLSLWCLSFTLIGMSTYLTTMIRSKANPGIDMYNVDNPYALKGYLGREQYGDFPLFIGQHYEATPIPDGGQKKGDKYVLRKDENGKLKYAKVGVDREVNYYRGDKVFLPRLWETNDPNHKTFYRAWLNPKSEVVEVTYTQDGNSIGVDQSLVDVFDTEEEAQQLANQKNQEMQRNRDNQTRYVARDHITYGMNLKWLTSYQINWMYFRYFMWNFAGKQNDIQGMSNKRDGNWISGISFIDKLRLGDQSMMPDSLKNNKANNKLYFLPLILGLIGIFYQLTNHGKDFMVNLLMFLMTGLAIVFYLNQWGPQPRERDYAFVGSFYAFAVWIGLGVLQVKDWLAKLTSGNVANIAATAVCALAVPVLMVKEEWDDHNRGQKTMAADLAHDYLSSCPKNAILFTIGDNDTYPLWYAQEVEGFRTDVRVVNTSLLGIDWYMDQLRYKVNESAPFNMVWKSSDYEGPKMEYASYEQYQNFGPSTVFPLDTMLLLALKQDESRGPDMTEYHYPSKNCVVKVDLEKAASQKLFSFAPGDSALSTMPIVIDAGKNYLTKGDFGILNVIAANISERPICFTDNQGDFTSLGLRSYLRREGMVYRVVPARLAKTVETDNSVPVMMNNFAYGSAAKKGVYFDEENRRHLQSIREAYVDVADQLNADGKTEDARKLLRRVHTGMPTDNMPYGTSSRYGGNNRVSLRMAQSAYMAGDSALGKEIFTEVEKDIRQEIRYFYSLANPGAKATPEEVQRMINDYDSLNAAQSQIRQYYGRGLTPEEKAKADALGRTIEDLQSRTQKNKLTGNFNMQEYYSTMQNFDYMRTIKSRFVEKANPVVPAEVTTPIVSDPQQPAKKDTTPKK